MSASIFADKAVVPTREMVEEKVGVAYTLWSRLESDLAAV